MSNFITFYRTVLDVRPQYNAPLCFLYLLAETYLNMPNDIYFVVMLSLFVLWSES
jgi:hypothetical protein